MGTKAPSGDRPANIHDVAALCGVAPSTVSRALTSGGRISASTRERVQQAADQLGYVPSRQARALSSGRTGTIAVLVPDISNPAYLAPLKGINTELKAGGYAQLLADTEMDPHVEATALEQLRKGTDGVIVAHSLLSDADLLAAAGRQPLVAINRHLPGVPAALVDPEPALIEVLDQLVHAGHRSVAYAGGAGAPPSDAAAEAMAVRRAAAARRLSLALPDLSLLPSLPVPPQRMQSWPQEPQHASRPAASWQSACCNGSGKPVWMSQPTWLSSRWKTTPAMSYGIRP
ncbi:LacI family DNA-binding transcriptional regulator [Arthrobacter sp. BHU FT2]|nr:LacI family DNA-binding transcriptional regulator [Arthrobacter sp. BHU FT2]